MTGKELLYVEDALGHEKFMKECSKKTSAQIKDVNLSNYIPELEKVHGVLYSTFLNLLQEGDFYGRQRFNGKRTFGN